MTAKIWTCLTKISKMPTLNGTRNSGKKTSIPSPAVLQHNVYTNALLKKCINFLLYSSRYMYCAVTSRFKFYLENLL